MDAGIAARQRGAGSGAALGWWMLMWTGCLVGGASAQSLSVTSALDGASSPFIPGQVVVIDINGFEAFRPFSVLMGDGSPGMALPNVQGLLGISGGSLTSIPLLDGIGLFGPASGVVTNLAGAARFVVRLPGPPLPLPEIFTLQVVALQNPIANGALFRLSNPSTVVLDEPPTSPAISGFSTALLNEGSPGVLTILGSGFLPQSTALPEVRFTSLCDPMRSAVATGVKVIDVDPGPGLTPALSVTPPSNLGGSTAAPLTGSGPVLVTVDYGPSGLYPNNPVNGRTTTPTSTFGSPLFLAYQTSLLPVVSAVSPPGGSPTGPCPLLIQGANFLNCARVFFSNGGPEIEAINVSVLSSTVITCGYPPLPLGNLEVIVRNIDHVPPSPRQSAVVPPQTTLAIFSIMVGDLSVVAINPPFIVEGAAGQVIQADVTCPVSGPWSALDPAFGLPTARVGSVLLGVEAAVPATVTATTILSPGLARLTITMPNQAPGLNPTGPVMAGRGNAGVKHLQIFASTCVNPGAVPSRLFSQIPAAEPNNRIIYRTAAAPTVTGFEPNNVGRVDGGQFMTLRGANFFTNDVLLPSTSPIGPSIQFSQGGTPVATVAASIVDATTLQFFTPDLTGAGLMLPATLDVAVINPDQQVNLTAGTADDFAIYPGLASTTANPFPLVGPGIVLDTGPFNLPQVFTFAGDVVIPSSLLVFAQGDGPLIIRSRGNITIQGALDLSGGSITSPPYFHPAGGARGADAPTPATLALQDPLQGGFGFSPYDSMGGVPFSTFGSGGFHGAVLAGGGGGGGMAGAGVNGQAGNALAGMGGPGLTLINLPIPVLGSGLFTEFYDPPGGAGGGAGGLGTPPPFNPITIPNPPDPVGFPGRGGNGGGSVVIAADGIITLEGFINVDGAPGGTGQFALLGPNGGGGGGGGAGGAVVLQSLHGIRLTSTAMVRAFGGNGGDGAMPSQNDGGAGSFGRIRFAVPTGSNGLVTVLDIDPLAQIFPLPETTGF